MNTSDPKTEIQFPPKRLPGADYFWYRERAGQGPDLLTLSGRPVKDIKRQGATYDEILQSCPDGNDGIAEVGSDGRIAYYPYRKMDGKADVLEASEDAVDPVAFALAEARQCPLLTGDESLRVAAKTEIEAKRTAQLPTIEVRGTLWLVEQMVIQSLLNVAEARESYKLMREGGRRLPWPLAEQRLSKLGG